MLNSFYNELERGLQTGFLDKSIKSDIVYQPKLLTNSNNPKKKVLTTILKELNKCDSFFISVAFVTTSGVAVLINALDSLEKRNVKGKILVSQYLNFTQPEALKRLSQFKNIDLRISTKGNSHSKAYIFKSKEHYSLIIGSSNLTSSALSTNKEWNLKVSALQDSSIIGKVLLEFESDFDEAEKVTAEYISSYDKIYQKQRLSQTLVNNESLKKPVIIEPNLMQQEALANIHNLRLEGKNKALLISATGTGKTYLSAFDAHAMQAKKLLFVVHRRNIAMKALETFQNIFGSSKTMGLYSGDQRETDKDFIFCTVQTLSKPGYLQQFYKKHFDYIVIDESHRSGAGSYKRIINYFQAKFLLGMTATPERTDGYDIFSFFDHNLAYEIRLNRAMDEGMLSPFHYYGITDISINEEELEPNDFNYLTDDERVDKIISKARFYGTDNGLVRGLVFCSRKEEAKKLSEKFNLKGYKTLSLSGDNSEEQRIAAINRLESDNLQDKLDYIFTVDIFNEGVDIPKVNQIILLRPTESAIIFIQQLGRGLRKTEGKGYLTVIDFISNYQKNYLIPVALYGDTSYNKDSLRKVISQGSQLIPGTSTINFDEITKDRIYKSIDSSNFRLLQDLKKDYQLLKYKLGRTPKMVDFIEHGERDPFSFVEHSRSYFNFVCRVDNEFSVVVDDLCKKYLELFSKEINNGKRVEEGIILRELLKKGTVNIAKISELVEGQYGYKVSLETIKSVILNLNFEFIRENYQKRMISVKERYGLEVVLLDNNTIKLSDKFKNLLQTSQFLEYLEDNIHYGILEFNKRYKIANWRNGFSLYEKYSRKDVFRILNATQNPVAQNVGGYKVSSDSSYCPIFVNYHKEQNISESTKYEDVFLNNATLQWMSKSNRSLRSSDVQSIMRKYGNIRLPLFIKKSNDEGQDFYYMGETTSINEMVEQTKIMGNSGNPVPIVKFILSLQDAVDEDLYSYITENLTSSTETKEEIHKVIEEPRNLFTQEAFTVPLFDFYAAAGSFSEIQSEKSYTKIEVPQKYSSKDYFACKIVGESMNRRIPNGSICLFKTHTGGSRDGKIVLVERHDVQDQDFNSAFTIKTYSSKKVVSPDGWSHSSIVLKPNSYDLSYEDIVVDEESAKEMRIIGEFIMVLDEEN